MRRLLLVAAVVSTVCETYRRGYAWPILCTAYSLVGKRPATTPDTDGDYMA